MATFGIAIGASLIVIALLISNTGIEQALRGQATGSLAWGPALFRGLLAMHGALLFSVGLIARTRSVPRPQSSARLWVKSLAQHKRTAWVVGFLLILALAVRLYKLDSQLWFDEVLTLIKFVRLPFGHMVTSFPNQNQHMLYSILAWISMKWFGESAWTLRLPAVMFGVLGILALYPLARKLSSGREALLACALMTFSYHHVWFSQNARGYTGLLFFSILSTWLWIEALDRGVWNWWIAYAVVLALGMWTQMALAFIVAAHGIVLLIEWLMRRRAFCLSKPAAAYFLAVSLSFQLYALTLPEFVHSAAGEVSMPSAWTNPLWLLTEVVRSLRVGFIGSVAVIGGGIFLLAGWWSLLRRNRAAALVMLISVVLCAATMLMLGHNLWPRFFFFAVGFAFIVVMRGTVIVGQKLSSARLGYALAVLLIAASAITIPRAYALPKQDFIGAREFVNQSREPHDAVVTIGLAGFAYKSYYAPEWRELSTAADLEGVLRSYDRVWLVYTLQIQIQGFLPDVWKAIQRDFTTVRVFPGTLGGGEVYVCRERRESTI